MAGFYEYVGSSHCDESRKIFRRGFCYLKITSVLSQRASMIKICRRG
jgi:hypothetical protein